MFRQCFWGRMRDSVQPFCDVDTEALLLVLYTGWQGLANNGIATIEPGTRSPSSVTKSIGHLATVRLQAQVLGPIAGPDVRIQWFVDNQVVVDTTAATDAIAWLDFVGEEASSITSLTLKVTDRSPLIHDTMRAASASQTSWTILVGPCIVDCGTDNAPPNLPRQPSTP